MRHYTILTALIHHSIKTQIILIKHIYNIIYLLSCSYLLLETMKLSFKRDGSRKVSNTKIAKGPAPNLIKQNQV